MQINIECLLDNHKCTNYDRNANLRGSSSTRGRTRRTDNTYCNRSHDGNNILRYPQVPAVRAKRSPAFAVQMSMR